MRRHSQISNKYLQQRIRDIGAAGKQQSIIQVEDQPLSNAEALSYLQGALDNGLVYFGCPNPLPNGGCPGHPD